MSTLEVVEARNLLLDDPISRADHQAEVMRLVAPRFAHRRTPTAGWMARARKIDQLRRQAGIAFAQMKPEAVAASFLPMGGGAASFNVVLDTTAPGGATLSLNGGATYATAQGITAALVTTDNPVTGYQIMIWGSVDPAANASIQTTQGASAWITPTWTGSGPFTASQAVTLSTGDALKTINARIRDDVWNETSTLTQTITLDTVVPTVNWTTGPDVTKVSTISGKRTVNATFTVGSEAITAWEVEVVANSGSVRGSGTVIGTTNGSTGVTGGSKAAAGTQAVVLDARDIQAASAGDGTKVIKVFVQDAAGNWST